MKIIGKYEVHGLLGRGGMSSVFKARLPAVNKMVALKLLSPHPHLIQLLGEREIQRLFMAEAAAMARLRHTHLVDILDFDYADGRPFFTMEYYYQNLGLIMGEGVRAETPSRVLSLDKIIHYGRQILLGLSRLHRAGMVHRDIKPHNLLITEDDLLKICDFGLSKLRGEKLDHGRGLIVGSPYYAAPEQERDPEGVDARADIFSAGVVFYRMLTGLLPADKGPWPSECHPDAEETWDAFVSTAVSHDRETRFPHAQAMLRALEALEAQWSRKKRQLCSGLQPGYDASPRDPVEVDRPRSAPLRLHPDAAQEVFQCDALGRPLRYAHHDFILLRGGDVVEDPNTGLYWQQSGSPDPLEWSEAHSYVDSLNARLHAGRSNWRLPTVNELFSLLKPFSHDDQDCMEATFARSKRWLWSADRRSFTAAWYVDAELGYAGWGDFTCRYFVRAVCGPDARSSPDPGRLPGARM